MGVWVSLIIVHTKYDLKPISGLSGNARKLFGQSESWTRQKISNSRPKVNHTLVVPKWMHPPYVYLSANILVALSTLYSHIP